MAHWSTCRGSCHAQDLQGRGTVAASAAAHFRYCGSSFAATKLSSNAQSAVKGPECCSEFAAMQNGTSNDIIQLLPPSSFFFFPPHAGIQQLLSNSLLLCVLATAQSHSKTFQGDFAPGFNSHSPQAQSAVSSHYVASAAVERPW